MAKKVFVGMSGGVDSSAAAALLLEKGYQVEGISLILTPDDNGSAISDAKAVAEKLDIKLHVLDFKREFAEKVIDYFVKEYRNGRTPNPCIVCNETVKFGLMLDAVRSLGGDYIATGHYARIEREFGRYILKKSRSKKDQSYFLSRLNQKQLAGIMFPVGEFEKDETRQIAADYGLPVAEKHDSQEICFVKDKDYAGFICRYTNSEPAPGNFVDLSGNVIGQHKGIIYYTIGQRKGLGVAFGEPMFVTGINCEKNEITLAPQGFQHKSEFIAENMNYISLDNPPNSEFEADVKIRCQAVPSRAHITPISEGVIKISFAEPQRAITPGQVAVLYDGDAVIGGGFIGD